MAKGKDAATGAGARGRVAQLRAAYRLTRRVDRRIGLILLGTFLAVLVAVTAVGYLLDSPIMFAILGVFTGLLATTIVFGRRAERAAYAQIEGQLGAAAAALQSLRRGWIVTPGVAANRDQAILHRAVGRPGVVLVGEGSPTRVAPLLAQEKRKYARIVPDVPVYDLQAGNGEGQVPLRRLPRELMKLPRNLKGAQVSEVDRRLKAVGSLNLPIPKGPLPRGARLPPTPRPPRNPR